MINLTTKEFKTGEVLIVVIEKSAHRGVCAFLCIEEIEG